MAESCPGCTAGHSEAEHISLRAAKLARAYNARDADSALEMFVDNGLDYSDYGVMALHMTKPAFRNFLTGMFATLQQLDLKTVSVSGHQDFTAWQWEMSFIKKGGKSEWEDIDKEGTEGQVMKMVGVSVSWWNEDEKIVKNCDYARFV